MRDRTRKAKWTMAVVLFGGFMLTFFMDAAGQELHQWLGIAVGLLSIA
jgi:cytochrome b